MNRDEMLFWRMIDACCKPHPDGPTDAGLVYQGRMENILDPKLTVRFLCRSDDIEVMIYVKRLLTPHDKDDDSAPVNGWIVAQNHYPWKDFKFGELVAWIEDNGQWNFVLEQYKHERCNMRGFSRFT